MWPGAASALAHVAQCIAAMNQLSRTHGKSGEMSVESADTVAMIDDNGAAVAIHQIGKLNHTVSRGDNFGADIARNIHTPLKCSFSPEPITPSPAIPPD